jgi:hypothetical protein
MMYEYDVRIVSMSRTHVKLFFGHGYSPCPQTDGCGHAAALITRDRG